MNSASSPVKPAPRTGFLRRGNLALRIRTITALALLIIASYLAWTSYDEYGKTLEQEYRFLETHARFGDAQIAGSLRSIDLLLQDVIDAKSPAPDLPADVVQRHQLNKLKQFPEIHYLITTDNTGQVVTAESLDDPMGVIEVRKFNAAQRDYFTVHRDAKPEDYYRYQLSRPFKTITNRHTIAISRAIRGENGQFLGIAVVLLSPAYFDSVLQQVLANEVLDAAAVHNRFGDIIYRQPDPEKYIGKNIAAGDAFKLYLRSDQHLTRYSGITVTDNVKRILVFSTVGDTGLDLGVSAKFDVVMAGWRHDLLMKALAFVITTGLALALALGSQRRLLERSRSEDALHESEQRFRTLLQTIPSVAVQGYSPDGTARYWNTASERLYGYGADEAIGRNLLDLIIPAEMQAGVRAAMREMFATGQPIPAGEISLRRKDGSKVDVFSSHALVKGQGPEMFCVDVDLSERKAAEKELEQYRDHLEALVQERTAALSIAKDAAEAANLAKSTFLANMSHELRTPMNAIMGMTSVALRRTKEPNLRDPLGKIDKASQHLLAVINDILDISKIEAGRLTLSEGNFILGEVLEKLNSLIGPKAIDKGLQLNIELTPDSARLALRGDALRLGQILFNLADNAVKFTETGSVTLRARPSEESPADVLLRFDVVDTGIGISAEEQQRIFSAFEQADNSMTRKYGGVGLGLIISKRLARMMGGDVGVASQPGAGSTFWLSVRLEKAAATLDGAVPPASTPAPPSAEAQLRAELAGARILLAEDDPVNLEIARGLLEDVGIAVDVAEDGAIAVALARQPPYALILLDVQMPRLNGVDATRAIRALPGHAETPILALTANAFEDDRRACKAAGMNDIIAKPVAPDLLYATLLKWLPASTAQDGLSEGNLFAAGGTAPATAKPALEPPAAAALRARLDAIDGLDVATGLAQVRGKLTSYARILKLFADGHADDADRLRAFVAQGDLAATGLLAHALKGAAGNLGAREVQALAAALDAALKRGEAEAAQAPLARLAERLPRLIAALHAALADDDLLAQAAAPAPRTAEQQQTLDELAALLASDDTRARHVLAANRPALAAALGSAPLAQLERLIDTFDYERALQQLKESA
jgi:two-component system sensor histidine kinase/response regulator